EAVLNLPTEAAMEGDERWEALQRAAVTVCRSIENCIWKLTEAGPQFEPGYASSPDLKVSKVATGQAARSEMTRAQILKAATTVVINPLGFEQELEALGVSRFFFVRWLATEARLALAYGTGAGIGFVEALLAFDTAIADLSAKKELGLSSLDPDDGLESNLPSCPERWFGMLCAGVVCTSPDLLTNLKIWLDTSNRLLGERAALTNNIRLILKGASLTAESLNEATIDAANPLPLRCGAAAQSLRGILSAEKTLQIQAFLTSGFVSDWSFDFQKLFNRHVARCFADSWATLAQSRFQFYSPRSSVPALLETLNGIERGTDTLKSVLIAAASALRQPLGEFMERVL
ncbi:MAG: hypothetical protein ACWGQW_25005, partial [bacterium]